MEAIRAAEKRTSGEIRVFVESKCKYMDAVDRAVEIFGNLKMQETADRNAVIVYLAVRDRQLAVYGDEGIHNKVGDEYWRREVGLLLQNFNKEDFSAGISQCVKEIGEALHYYFPYDRGSDKNELPDEIVFGK